MKTTMLAAALAALSTAAFAADLPYKVPAAPPPVVAPVAYSWAGLYAGANVGGAWGRSSTADLNGGVAYGPFGYSNSGATGGGQVGYAFSWSGFVFGPEIGFGYLNATGKSTIGSASAAAHQDLTTSGGMYVDATARLGYGFDRYLAYVKGGYSHIDAKARQQTTNPGYFATPGKFGDGWVAGAGLAYALTNDLFLNVEYLHRDYGSANGYQTNVGDLSSPIGYRFNNRTSYRVDSVTVGANWKFNGL